MPTMKRTARMLTVAALAASTALSSPLLAMAQQQPLRLAQAATEELPPAEAAPAEEPAPAEAAPPADEPAAEAPAAEAPAAEAPAEAPAEVAPEAPVEAAPAEAPAAEAPPVEAPPAEAAPAEAPAAVAPEAAPAAEPTPEPAAPAEAAPADAAPAEAPAAETAPAAAPEAAPTAPAETAPAAETPAATEASPAPTEAPAATAPAAAEPAPAAATPDATTPAPAAVAPEAAPAAVPPATTGETPAAAPAAVTDPAAPAGTGERRARGGEAPRPVPADVQTAPVEQGAIGQSDARVQTLATPVVEQPIAAQRGERVERAPAPELPPEAKVVERVGNRDIISLGAAALAGAAAGAAAGYFIRSNDDERLSVDSRDSYTERLPRGRTRETIERANGSQIITITNRYGDVVQRSRITPDGREVVLFYDPYSEEDERPDYYSDAGEDLPPLELSIPRDRYIVDIDEPDEELYFDTIVAPPVETVERIYSVNEVRRSSRIRDKVRRIDLNTVQFDFGSATIPQAQVKNLQALADAVGRVIKDNPGETFLIEGHTDAVGSNVANLALSDQRAESVATALSQYFDVPAENLVTQGYGEEDLKVDTQEANAENRRVTLRRITALVKPVTAAAR
jgi:outer membrane protein OmpA-like peptidoglycan-associated protein